MAGLKELRTRIEAVKSTKKITSAMKMVAAAGLRRAQGLIDKSAAYKNSLLSAARRTALDLKLEEAVGKNTQPYSKLMTGNGNQNVYRLLVISSDKGLCGSYNAAVAKVAKSRIKELQDEGKTVQIFCIGKKARELLKRQFADLIIGSVEGIARKGADFHEALDILTPNLEAFEKAEVGQVEIVGSIFKSAISRVIEPRVLLPVKLEVETETPDAAPINLVNNAFYDYEPDKAEMLEALILMLVKAEMFDAIAQAQASEQGARMASMDSATRNASEMISKLTLRYNGLRQTAITTELTEIISGAEAI